MSFFRSLRRPAGARGIARVKRSSPNRELLVPEEASAIETGGNLAPPAQGREILAVRGARLAEEARRYYDGHRGMVHAVGGGLLLLLVAGFAKRRRLI